MSNSCDNSLYPTASSATSRVISSRQRGFSRPTAQKCFALFPWRERVELEGVVVRKIGEHLVGTKGVARRLLEQLQTLAGGSCGEPASHSLGLLDAMKILDEPQPGGLLKLSDIR